MSDKNKKSAQRSIHFGYVQKQKGEEAAKRSVYLHEDSRLSNLLVLSTKNSGKSKHLIPMMFEQDLKQKDTGITIVVGSDETAFDLYAMAKGVKRKVHLLKPSVNFEVLDHLLYMKTWDYDYINDHIINYKKAINDKDVVIIDMEIEKYSLSGVRAVDLLLMQLQSDMRESKRTHYVYIDETYRYLDFISNLLEYGSDHGIVAHLFFQSRSQFKTANNDYTTLIDANVRNTILLQGINYDDAVYYAARFNIPKLRYPTDLMDREYGEFTFEFLGEGDFKLKKGNGKLMGLTEERRNTIRNAAERYRKKLLKEHPQTDVDRNISLINERSYLEKINKFLSEQDLSKESHLDVIAEELRKAEELGEKEVQESIAEDISGDSIEDVEATVAENETVPENFTEDENVSENVTKDDVGDVLKEESRLSKFFDQEKEKDKQEEAPSDELPSSIDDEFDTLDFDPADLDLGDFEMLTVEGKASEPLPEDDETEEQDEEISLTDGDSRSFVIEGSIDTEIVDGITSSRPIRIPSKNDFYY